MSDTNNTGEKTLGAAPSKTLHLKRPVEQGMVRQSFSHGRSKAVVVEKVKRRIPGAGEAPAREAAPAAPLVLRPAAPQPAAAPVAPRGPTSQGATARAATTPAPAAPLKTGVVLPSLTEAQREARAKALEGARAREEEDRRRQEAEAKLRAEREARERSEREAAEARKREEELRRAQDADFKRKTEEEARRRSGRRRTFRHARRHYGPQACSLGARRNGGGYADVARALLKRRTPNAAIRRGGVAVPAAKVILPPRPTRGAEQRNRGRLTVASATAGEEERTRSVAAFRRRTQRLKGHGLKETKEKLSREIVLPEIDHDSGTRQPHVRARRRRHQALDATGPDGHADRRAGGRHRPVDRRGNGPHGQTRRRIRRRGRSFRPARRRRRIRAASGDRHDHGPCRPRQDVAARRDSQGQCRGGRSWRHHSAYRRLSGHGAQAAKRSPSSTRPATPPSRRCGRAAPRSRISSFWSWRPTTA